MRADLHVHTVLSPCASLDMTPVNIVQHAINKGLDVIAITDHNSTRQCVQVLNAAFNTSLTVVFGAEVTTREEIHCLVYLPVRQHIEEFQAFLDQHLPNIPNNTLKFGYQVVVNEREEILYEEPRLLLSALPVSLEELCNKVHQWKGLVVPAHINKSRDSLLSQLGFVPPNLQVDAFELFAKGNTPELLRNNPGLKDSLLLTSSDAHSLNSLGLAYTEVSDHPFWHLLLEDNF